MFFKSFQRALRPLQDSIDDLISKKVPQCHHTSKDLLREILHSWTNKSYNKELSEGDKIAREDAVNALYEKHLEPLLNELLADQMEFYIKNTENWEQVLFGRGSINGLDLIKERLERLRNASLERQKPVEKFNKYGIMPEN